MQICFFDIGLVSVFAGREANADWGVRSSPWNAEVWAGRTYVCASFSERIVKRTSRLVAVALAAFCIGWFTPPPEMAEVTHIEPAAGINEVLCTEAFGI